MENTKRDTYYSDTDRYEMNLFTDEFRGKEIQVVTDKETILKTLDESVFYVPTIEAGVEYSEVQEYMFADKPWNVQYRDKENSGAVAYIISGILMMMVFCFVSVYYFAKRKKNRKDDNYICKYS